MWWQTLHTDVSCHEYDDKNYTLTWLVTNVATKITRWRELSRMWWQKLHTDVWCHKYGDKHYTLTWVVTNVVTNITHWRELSWMWWQKLHTDVSCHECGDKNYTLMWVVDVVTKITHWRGCGGCGDKNQAKDARKQHDLPERRRQWKTQCSYPWTFGTNSQDFSWQHIVSSLGLWGTGNRRHTPYTIQPPPPILK